MESQLSTLPNGVRVATFAMPYSETISFGIWTTVGGRHESAELSGISHFIEHLLFKGTKRRSARRISQEIEGVGGYLNAFTAEEQTCYHASSAAAYFPKVFSVMADLYLNPRFAPIDIERERGVIAEEITMYHDESAQYVLELLSEVLWPKHPLGRPLTGSLQTVGGIDRNAILDYRAEHYHGGNTIVSAAGRLDHAELVERVQSVFGDLPAGVPSLAESAPRNGGRVRIRSVHRPTEQTHLALGLPTFRSSDRRRHALAVLNTILGGNMSSRLFQSLREQKGLCYSVQSSTTGFVDTGALAVTLGLDKRNLSKSLELILREFERLRSKPVGVSELRRAKDYLIGSSRMSLERTSSQSNRLGCSLSTFGRLIEPAETQRKIEAVTDDDLQALANQILKPNRLRIAAVGGLEGEAEIRSVVG